MLELTLTPTGVNQVRVAVNGTPAHRFDLGAIAPTAEGGRVIPDDPAAYGRALYAALFPPDGPAAEALTALPAAPDPRATLLLVLDHPVLDAIPWELLHDGARFLALDFYLLRGLPPDRRRAAWSEARLERLPILFLPASPLLSLQGEPEERPLAVLEEWEALREAIAGLDAPYDLVQVLPPTLDALDEALADVATGIVHFAGHGTVTEEGAFLLFEQPNGASHPVPADHFVRRVRGKARLVFLNACLTAAPARTDLAGLARALVAQGIPYALGMQFTVPDATARRFAARFYTYLARSHPVEEAVRRARMALEEEPLLMAIPVLYTGLSRPRARFPLAEGQARVRTPPPPPERVDLSDLPPVEGEFVGRQRELVDLGDLLTGEARPPAITIHGGGGMGKTALAREAARRFAWAFPDGVLTLSLERLPSPERLLTRLGDFLGLPRDPEEPVRRWRHRVEEALRARRLLLVVDNAETLVRAVEGERGEEGGAEEQEERARARAIGGLLRRAVGGKTTLLLTGRAVVGLPREEVVPLTGLTPSAGARLFAQHAGTGRERADRAEMEALSRQVGGHPLALRLLAAAFEDFPRSLADFRKGLAARLPTVEDPWSEEARHESLWACFDYSYEALPRELQERFPRLALFTAPFPPEVVAAVLGEAEEAVGEWLHRLWRRGMVERVKVVDPTGWALLYRLHPTLGAYAEAKAGEAVLAPLRPAFGEAYAALAAHAYGTIWQKPVLAQVVQRMLPDLERAVGWVEDEGRASAFRFHLGWLLRHYGDLEGAMGLYRESLAIKERLGDQQGMAITLGMMGQTLWAMERHADALRALVSGLALLQRLGIEPQTQRAMAEVLIRWRQELGPERFDPLWQEATGQPLPPWLREPPGGGRHRGPRH